MFSFPNSMTPPIPQMPESGMTNELAALKQRIEAAKPLGLVKSNPDEYLVIYDGQWLKSSLHRPLPSN